MSSSPNESRRSQSSTRPRNKPKAQLEHERHLHEVTEETKRSKYRYSCISTCVGSAAAVGVALCSEPSPWWLIAWSAVTTTLAVLFAIVWRMESRRCRAETDRHTERIKILEKQLDDNRKSSYLDAVEGPK